MRIGLYGMPAAGKTYILDRIDFMDVYIGSALLRERDPEFDFRNDAGRAESRKGLARMLSDRDTFIMDGHYSFGDETAFTEDDGKLYDTFLYLYVSPDTLRERMEVSTKNRKYLRFDVAAWQEAEIAGLRRYCHLQGKDFYVLDKQPGSENTDVADAVSFIKAVTDGYSCVEFASRCAGEILSKCVSDTVVLMDGDKTLTMEDTSRAAFGYMTHLFDGNFYTGYQAWMQEKEFARYTVDEMAELPVRFNRKVKNAITKDTFILTSGHGKVWGKIADRLGLGFFHGPQMCAETKYYITRHLQETGKRVLAYGDGMNDYYMLKQADEGYLVAKPDGTVSKSLAGMNMEGINIV